MDLSNDVDNNKQTKQTTIPMATIIHRDDHHRHQTSCSNCTCIICGSKAIGMNFGAPTCAPCKAFFRRNARRKEILESSCQHSDQNPLNEKNIDINDKTIRYLQIRRCSSCRLRRCFEVGMKEVLVRTEEENQRHKQLVNTNRQRRELLKQQQQERQSVFPQLNVINSDLLNEIDWRHLSNIVYAYDKYCLKTYAEQRANMFIDETLEKERIIDQYTAFPISVIYSLSSFIRSLPALQSLSRSMQLFLCKSNLRRLIFFNLHELNQSCFSEPRQIVAYKTGWQVLCGPELYKQFVHIQELAEILIIADPIVTRLWLVVLFFSTPLFAYYDPPSSIIKMKKKVSSIDIQNAYVTLLWKYLLHRHGYMESVRIYSNLVHVFLHMLQVGIDINIRLRTHKELMVTHTTLDQLSTLDININQ